MDLIHGDMVSMIEGAAAATTTTTGTDTSFVSDAESETLISTSSSMIETNDNAQPNDTNGDEDKQINVVKTGETTKMSLKTKLLLRKALSKAAGSSDSVDGSTMAVDSSSDDADATAEDIDSESYSKSNQPKAFRQSTGDPPGLSYHMSSNTTC